MNTLKSLSRTTHGHAKRNGFYDDGINRSEKLLLVTCEVAEAVECLRKSEIVKIDNSCIRSIIHGFDIYIEDDKVQLDPNHIVEFKASYEQNIKDTYAGELADIILRVLDLAEADDIDLESHIIAKIAYNTTRPYKHGKNF